VEAVLDTVSLKHLLRVPRQGRSRRGRSPRLETALDTPMQKQKLCLALDKSGGLISEWKQTCGADVVEVVFTRWVELNAIVLVDDLPKIGLAINKKLRQLGFTDTIDKIVLRLGLIAKDHIVVSDDNDFWNPKSTMERGNRNAPVARLCREGLGVTVTLLRPLLQQVRS
jgi:hypothetical protein